MQHTRRTLPQWATNLKKYRKENGFTQTEFGKLFGVGGMAVSYWESGRTEPPAPVLIWLLIASGDVTRDSIEKTAGFKFGPERERRP